MRSLFLLHLVNRFSLYLVSASTTAQLGKNVAASWVEQVTSTPAPTLGSFGETSLAVVTARLLNHYLARKRPNVDLLVITGLPACLSWALFGQLLCY